MSSIFTKIINREIPSDIVYEDDEIIAFKDIYPEAPVHILVVPKKEIKNIDDAKQEDIALLGKLQLVIARIAREYGIDKTGYRVITNNGDDAGQTVFHLHYHLIGGRKLGVHID